METANVWKPDGQQCSMTNVKNGNAAMVMYTEEGTEWLRITYKNGGMTKYTPTHCSRMITPSRNRLLPEVCKVGPTCKTEQRLPDHQAPCNYQGLEVFDRLNSNLTSIVAMDRPSRGWI